MDRFERIWSGRSSPHDLPRRPMSMPMPTATKPSSSGPRRKSRWDTPAPDPKPNPTPAPSLPPPPAYGFHNLERRTILLADGTLRSYFALPPDDRPSVPPAPPERGRTGFHPPSSSSAPVMSPPDAFLRGGCGRDDYWGLLAARAGVPEERRLDDDDERARARGRAGEVLLQNNQHHLLHYDGYGRNPDQDGRRRSSDRLEYAGHRAADSPRRREDGDGRRPLKYSRGDGEIDGNDNLHSRRGLVGGDSYASKRQHLDVGPAALKKAFLAFSKSVNESASQKKKYLEGGKHGPLPCLVCDRFGENCATVSEVEFLPNCCCNICFANTD